MDKNELVSLVSRAYNVPVPVVRHILSTSLPSVWTRRLRDAQDQETVERLHVFLGVPL
mgnify:CR=1 FL=1